MKSYKDILERASWTLSEFEPGEPYEYIIKGACELSSDEFESFIDMMVYSEDDGIYTINYEGYNYWIADEKNDASILYRQKDFSEFDSLPRPIETHYSEQMLKEVAKMIGEKFPGRNIFEAACGTGSLVKAMNIPVDRYRGVDPSQNAIDAFLGNLPEYSDRVFCKSLEQAYPLWQNTGEVIVATFGAPNYFMRQYLTILSESKKDIFLMFYKPDFLPEEFKTMHESIYSKEELKALFPHCIVMQYEDYLIVTTR